MRKLLKKLAILAIVAAYLLVGYSNVFAVERVYILPATTQITAPKNNVFQLKGSSDKYILLDTTDEGYFVLTEKYKAVRPLSLSGDPVAFDPEDKNSIAYWLNHDFLDGAYLPDIVLENLVEREYVTEGGGSKVPFSKEYRSTCKVVLLSQTEWSKYNAKFGYADDTSLSYWALRSVRDMTGNPLVACLASPNSGLTGDGKWTSSTGIRPAFYLSKDFFEKASIDVNNTGDSVLSLIRNTHSKEILSEMYDSQEMYTLTETDLAPLAASVSIVGRGIVGEKVNGTYSFVSLDSSYENGTLIQWQKSYDGKTWSSILNSNKTYYIPTEADIGYYLRMKISPMTDSMSGASYTSSALKCTIRPVSAPVATDVRILNAENAKPGTIMDVKYAYDDENRDICIRTDYVWESSDDMVTVKEIGNSRNYKLTNAEAGKYVRVGLAPVKRTNSAVGRKEISGEKVYSEWFLVESLPTVSTVTLSRNVDATISVSKTDNGISLMSSFVPQDGSNVEKITATYEDVKTDGVEVICEWQGSYAVDGIYSTIANNTNVLEYAPENVMWVRAKVYSKNDVNVGKAVYSEPMFIGNSKEIQTLGEFSVSEKLSAGKKYELWISTDSLGNCYTYSFLIEGPNVPTVSSEEYAVKNVKVVDKNYIIGTVKNGSYSSDYCFKAGEFTAEKDGTITISDVLTTTLGNEGVLASRVFVVEK